MARGETPGQCVLLGKGTSMEEAFVYRNATPADLDEWGTVAGAAFAFKGGDPRRFRWNYDADPTASPNDIFVSLPAPATVSLQLEHPTLSAGLTLHLYLRLRLHLRCSKAIFVMSCLWFVPQLACKQGRIAASVRTSIKSRAGFRQCSSPCLPLIALQIRCLPRRVYVDGRVIATRGIADVCTHPDFQRQGAAGVLLTNIGQAMPTMAVPDPADSPTTQLSALHAAESMRPFYSKFGYASVPMHMTVLSVPFMPATSPSSTGSVTVARETGVLTPHTRPAVAVGRTTGPRQASDGFVRCRRQFCPWQWRTLTRCRV